jgi:hypothetical protein
VGHSSTLEFCTPFKTPSLLLWMRARLCLVTYVTQYTRYCVTSRVHQQSRNLVLFPQFHASRGMYNTCNYPSRPRHHENLIVETWRSDRPLSVSAYLSSSSLHVTAPIPQRASRSISNIRCISRACMRTLVFCALTQHSTTNNDI